MGAFFGWAIGRLHMVPIDRSAKGDAWQRVASIGAKLMDQGKWIIMFPEGTGQHEVINFFTNPVQRGWRLRPGLW